MIPQFRVWRPSYAMVSLSLDALFMQFYEAVTLEGMPILKLLCSAALRSRQYAE